MEGVLSMKKLISLILTMSLLSALLCTGTMAAGSSTKAETMQILGIMTGDGNTSLTGEVTRAQFAQMLVAASEYKDSVGDYGSSLFKDLKGDHWASSYVRIAVEQGWMSGFLDGTFRPDQAITLEEGCTALLKVLGYDAGTLKGSYPTPQLSTASSIGLLDDVSAVRGSKLTRQDCVDLFYNLLVAKTKSGAVYGTTLGYTVTNGEVDYSALVSADTKGPYVAESGRSLTIPFSAASATFYRDGTLSDAKSIQQYDVYYYNENMRTVWAYSDKVTGTLTAVSPNRAAPTSATVAGVSYPLEGSQAVYKLSSQGGFQEGGLVTLLLSKDGGVVDVISALEREAVYYGVVVSTKKGASNSSTSTSGTASAQWSSQVACTDGVVRTFYHSGGAAAGKLVTVTVSGDETKLSSLPTKRLSGTVNSNGTRFAGYPFAEEVEILDTDDEGGYARIYPSRLAGSKLDNSEVCYYTLNAAGEIDRMVLREATGDTYNYVYITSAEKNKEVLSTSLTYLQNGEQKNYSTNALLTVGHGGAAIFYDDGAVKTIRQLKSVKLDRLGDLTAAANGKTYQLDEKVQVLLTDNTVGRKYYAAALSDINAGDYSLTGWYDDLGCSAGGRIRVIVAVPK